MVVVGLLGWLGVIAGQSQTAENVWPLTAKPGDGWVIRWDRSDDFSGADVDWRKWRKTPAHFSGWKWDNAANVSVTDGRLMIALRKRAPDNSDATARYTSGMLQSYAAGRYGYFEARIKGAPKFPGVSPAFWMFSRIDDTKSTPGEVRYCEVDVVELTQRHSHRPDNVRLSDHNLHAILSGDQPGLAGRDWRRPHDERYRESQANEYLLPFDPREAFHTYGCRVARDWITWYVDGKEVGRKPNTFWHQPMNVALSLGLRAPYAQWKDNRLKSDPEAGAEQFATSMEVDYVRVWELVPEVKQQD